MLMGIVVGSVWRLKRTRNKNRIQESHYPKYVQPGSAAGMDNRDTNRIRSVFSLRIVHTRTTLRITDFENPSIDEG